MPKPAWQEPLEQWGGHFFLLGIIGELLIGPFSVILYMVREFTKFRIGKWKIGQWPPGDPWWSGVPGAINAKQFTDLSRVSDMARDLTFMLSGNLVARVGKEAWLMWQAWG